MPTARDTISGLHLGTGLVAFAATRALQDAAIHTAALRAEDRGHMIGRQRYAAIIRQRQAVQAAEADQMAAWLNRRRKQLHG